MRHSFFLAIAIVFALSAGASAQSRDERNFESIYERNHSYFMCYSDGGTSYNLDDVSVYWPDSVYDLEITERDGSLRTDYMFKLSLMRDSVRVVERRCDEGTMYQVEIGCAEPCFCKWRHESILGDLAGAAACGAASGANILLDGRFYFEFADRRSANDAAVIFERILKSH